MVKASFIASCPFEIGDEMKGKDGKVYRITDIACTHYVRKGIVEFSFELDHSGRYIPLKGVAKA